MNNECQRTAQQLVSNVDGDAWYGDSLRKILAGVTAEQARAHPIPNAHSIWELVLHLNAWVELYSGAIQGKPIPPWPGMPQQVDWPPLQTVDETAWRENVRTLFENHLELADRMAQFADDRLVSTVPGRSYDFRQLFQGASLHAVYHAGQIALLKKTLG